MRSRRVRSMPAIGTCEVSVPLGPLMGLGCNVSAGALEHVGHTSVVVAGLDDDEAVPVDRVDQPMLVSDPPRPVAGQVRTGSDRAAPACR